MCLVPASLGDLVTPDRPALPFGSSEEIEIRTGRHRFDEVVELVGLFAVRAARPLKPCGVDPLSSRERATRGEQDVFSGQDVGAPETEAVGGFAPNEERGGFKTPGAGDRVCVLDVAVDRPQV